MAIKAIRLESPTESD